MKIERKFIFDLFYKNRYLILLSGVLIAGTIFGTSMLGFLPENMSQNLFGFLSRESTGFRQLFLNRFCFPFVIFISVYLCGFSIIGSFLIPAIIFIFGALYGFENALMYKFSGIDYITSAIISYFTAMLYFGFLLIILSESSVFLSRTITIQIKSKNEEKPHYNAKNQTVKFITFTLVFAIFSVFSAYISPIIQSWVQFSF